MTAPVRDTERRTITLRGIVTADAVRMFGRGVAMVVQPHQDGAEIPAGWLPVLLATPLPKHKSSSTKRRNRERRERYFSQAAEGQANG